jgi:hypothetical protein
MESEGELAAEPVFGIGVAPSNRCQWKFGATCKSMRAESGSRQRVRNSPTTRSAVQKSGCKHRLQIVCQASESPVVSAPQGRRDAPPQNDFAPHNRL